MLWSPSEDNSAVIVYRNLVGLNAMSDRASYLAMMSAEYFGNTLDITRLRLVAPTARFNLLHEGEVVIRTGETLEITAAVRDAFVVRTPAGIEVKVPFKQVVYVAKDAGAPA